MTKKNDKTLYIIGNGFDLAHKIPSAYKDFRNFMVSHVDFGNIVSTLEELKNCFTPNFLWSDFENELGRISPRQVFDYCYQINDSPAYLLSEDVHLESTFHLYNRLENAMRAWIDSLNINCARRHYKINPKDCFFITFNYTYTLEQVYNINDCRILHIHGKGIDPIFGHGEKDLPYRGMPENYYIRKYADLAYDYAHLFFDHMKKNSKGCIYNSRKFFKKLKGIENIAIIGHSLGKSDYQYFKYLNKILPNANWTYYYYTPDKHRNAYVKRFLLSTLQIPTTRFNLQRVENLFLNRGKNRKKR